MQINISTVRFKNRAAKAADDGSPRSAIKRYKTKPRRSLHVSDFCTTTAPGTRSCRRFACFNLLLLVHQETETHHSRSFFKGSPNSYLVITQDCD